MKLFKKIYLRQGCSQANAVGTTPTIQQERVEASTHVARQK